MKLNGARAINDLRNNPVQRQETEAQPGEVTSPNTHRVGGNSQMEVRKKSRMLAMLKELGS